jgi:hypothetical protein
MKDYLKIQVGTGREVANLKQTDRCDRCPAAASSVVAVTVNDDRTGGHRSLPLLFCNHHVEKHMPAIAGNGYPIYRKESL